MDATTTRRQKRERSDFELLQDYGRRNWRVVLACVVAAVGIAVLYLALSQPSYKATAVMIMQPQSTQGEDQQAAPATPELVRSQLEILKSQRVLSLAVDRLNLARDPAFTAEAPGGASIAVRKAAAREELAERLLVENDGRSYTITLTASAADPEKAARIANTVAQAYIEVQRQQKVRIVEAAEQGLSRRLADLRSQTIFAEQLAENYRQQSGLVPLSSVPEDSESYAAATPASREIIEMSREHASLAAQRAQALARSSAQRNSISRGRGDSTAEVLSSSVVSNLRVREAQLSQRRSELLARYEPAHPLVGPVEAELAQIRRQLGDEIQRIHSSVDSQARASQQAFRSGDAFMQQLAGERSSDLAASTRLNQLQRDAKIKRETYEEFAAQMQRAAERASLQLPDVLLVSPASPPIRDSAPNPALLLLVAAIIGLVIGLALGLLRSMLSNREVVVDRHVAQTAA